MALFQLFVTIEADVDLLEESAVEEHRVQSLPTFIVFKVYIYQDVLYIKLFQRYEMLTGYKCPKHG